MKKNLLNFKKSIILIFSSLLILFAGFIYRMQIRNPTISKSPIDQINTIYTQYNDPKSDFIFEFPERWYAKNDFTSDERLEQNNITLFTPDMGFEVHISTQKWKNDINKVSNQCEKYNDCGGRLVIGQTRFKTEDFDYLKTSIADFIISKDAGVFSDGTLVKKSVSTKDEAFYVYQVNNDTATSEMRFLNYLDEKDNVKIWYTFRSSESFSEWDDYKVLVKHILNSMDKK